MPKDFNELLAPDRQFTVHEETFTWHDVRPEVLTAFSLEAQSRNGDDPNSSFVLMDDQILLFIEPDERERWRELRKREEKPVTIIQMVEIVKWLMETQSEYPTNQPSPSEVGPGKTASSSSAKSP